MLSLRPFASPSPLAQAAVPLVDTAEPDTPSTRAQREPLAGAAATARPRIDTPPAHPGRAGGDPRFPGLRGPARTAEGQVITHAKPVASVLEQLFLSVWIILPFTDRIAPPGYEVVDSMVDGDTGMVAAAYRSPAGDIVIAYSGTSPVRAEFPGMVLADKQIVKGENSRADRQAAYFAQRVYEHARARGVPDSRISVTGISLGGHLAQVAGQKTGIGGVGFVGPGVPADPKGADGSNFVLFNVNGDAVGLTATKNERLLGGGVAELRTPTGAPIVHYGKVIDQGPSFLNDVTGAFTRTLLSTQANRSGTKDGQARELVSGLFSLLWPLAGGEAGPPIDAKPGQLLPHLVSAGYLGTVDAGGFHALGGVLAPLLGGYATQNVRSLT